MPPLRVGSRVLPYVGPGPGEHGVGEGSFTKQSLSYKKSMPQYGFGWGPQERKTNTTEAHNPQTYEPTNPESLSMMPVALVHEPLSLASLRYNTFGFLFFVVFF